MKYRKTIIGGAMVLILIALVFIFVKPQRKHSDHLQQPQKAEVYPKAINSPTPLTIGTQNAIEKRKQKQLERARAIAGAIEGTNVPIEFFGKVVDQDGQPLQDVTVLYSYSVEKGNKLGVPWGQQLIEKNRTSTGKSGLFSIVGVKGHTLAIDSLNKDGYKQIRRESWNFDYYESSAAGKFEPLSNKPVVFTMLAEITAEHLVVYGGDFGLPMDVPGNGSPVRWNLWKGRLDPNGELQITLKREPAFVDQNRKITKWDAQIGVAGGGIIEASSDESIFRAPEAGYSPLVEYPKMEQKRGIPRRSFYVKTSDGKYGRIELELYYDDNGPNARCFIKAYLNPSGSRNLEYDPAKQINPH